MLVTDLLQLFAQLTYLLYFMYLLLFTKMCVSLLVSYPHATTFQGETGACQTVMPFSLLPSSQELLLWNKALKEEKYSWLVALNSVWFFCASSLFRWCPTPGACVSPLFFWQFFILRLLTCYRNLMYISLLCLLPKHTNEIRYSLVQWKKEAFPPLVARS